MILGLEARMRISAELDKPNLDFEQPLTGSIKTRYW